MLKEIQYKAYTITLNLSGWYSADSFKSDNLAGIKKLINNHLKSKT